ncbi:MAG: hypothetical protein WCO93_08670, partial [bacterium]
MTVLKDGAEDFFLPALCLLLVDEIQFRHNQVFRQGFKFIFFTGMEWQYPLIFSDFPDVFDGWDAPGSVPIVPLMFDLP